MQRGTCLCWERHRRQAIIDAELAACVDDGLPRFKSLIAYGKSDDSLCAFDLFQL
jgi:hypothetical protein